MHLKQNTEILYRKHFDHIWSIARTYFTPRSIRFDNRLTNKDHCVYLFLKVLHVLSLFTTENNIGAPLLHSYYTYNLGK